MELNFKYSIFEKITYKERPYYLKRDDLIHPIFNGNKARKLFFLTHKKYKKISIYGGNQSNMIPPLALLVKEFGIEVDYYTKNIPNVLKNSPSGNYEVGKDLINFIEVNFKDWDETIEDLKKREFAEDEILIHQGGLQEEAEEGVKLLCQEIVEFANEENLKDLSIFLPSGTGATALFMQKNLPFRVFTAPCVGDKDYLLKQFLEIEEDKTKHPVILDTPKKYHFGKPYEEFLKVFLELKRDTGITFDLLYDPKGWKVLDLFRENMEGEVLYIHQGGILGNSSQLERYKHKNLLKF